MLVDAGKVVSPRGSQAFCAVERRRRYRAVEANDDAGKIVVDIG